MKEFEDSDMLLDAFEEKFAEYQEDFQYNAVSEIYKKIVFLNENGKEEEAKIKKKRHGSKPAERFSQRNRNLNKKY